MTDPVGIVMLDAVVTAPTARFVFVIAVVAAACVMLTTLGTARSGGPDETMRATALPMATCVPAVGLWLMTDPAGIVVLDALLIAPTNRLAFVIAVMAPVCVMLTTSGTATSGGPDETTRAMALPMVTCIPAVG